jgi:predicted dehydrogenase
VRTAVIGCGDVATGQYIPYLSGSPFVELRVCADLDMDRARAVAGRFGLTARPVDDAIADPEVEMILDLTPPLAHFSINASAVQAGKHVYTEKPLAATFEEGQRLLAMAADHGQDRHALYGVDELRHRRSNLASQPRVLLRRGRRTNLR